MVWGLSSKEVDIQLTALFTLCRKLGILQPGIDEFIFFMEKELSTQPHQRLGADVDNTQQTSNNLPSMPPPPFQLLAGDLDSENAEMGGPILESSGDGFTSVPPPPDNNGDSSDPIQCKFSEHQDEVGQNFYRDDDSGDIYHYQMSHNDGSHILKNDQFIVRVSALGDLLEKHPVPQPMNTGSMTEEGEESMAIESPQQLDPTKMSDEVIPYPLEAGREAMRETGVDPSKFTTDLTTQIILVPVEQGELGEAHSGIAEYRYTPNQIWLQSLDLGDKDRPETRFENQESHTVAWTLVRNGILGLQGQSLAGFLNYIAEEFTEIEPFMGTLEGEMMHSAAQGQQILTLMLSGKLPVDIWQRMASELLIHYLQVYQLSQSATYKRGPAKGHGEAHAMKRLKNDEEQITQGDAPRAAGKVAIDCGKLLDVQFRVNSLGVQAYAYAIRHWLQMLESTFPQLVKKYQAEIMKPILSKQVANSFKDELSLDRSKNFTVKDLMEKYDYIQSEPPKPREERDLEQIDLERTAAQQLNTNFLANVSLQPDQQGVQAERQISDTIRIQDMVYAIGNLSIRGVQISDSDRPKTKFLKDQKSHTVPWTLARNAVISFQGKSLKELIEYLFMRFQELALDVKIQEGIDLTTDGITLLKTTSGQQLPIDQWQAIVSEAVRKYFIAYQVADSTAYINPQEAERALGHGEGSNMAVLRRNEHAIGNLDGTIDDEARILSAIYGMFDAQVTSTLSEKAIKQAFLGMQHKLKMTFPLVCKHFLAKAVATMETTVMKQTGRTLKEIMNDDSLSIDTSSFETLNIADPLDQAAYQFGPGDLVDATGTVQPAHLPTFRNAYRQDLAQSSAYLTEAEGQLAAHQLGITVNVFEGQLPEGWTRVENLGGGHCLLHSLYQAVALNAGQPVPKGASATQISALRTYIAANLGNDVLDPLITVAVIGRVLGAPEPGLGSNMRTLLAHPSITVARRIEMGKGVAGPAKKGKSSTTSASPSKQSEVDDEAAMDIQPAIATFGNGAPLDNIALLHIGAHYVMIRRNQ